MPIDFKGHQYPKTLDFMLSERRDTAAARQGKLVFPRVNIAEQDHRFIKKITRPMLGFKAFHSAVATLAGNEAAHMIHKGSSVKMVYRLSSSLRPSLDNCVQRRFLLSLCKTLRQSPMASALIEAPIFDNKMTDRNYSIDQLNAHIERVKRVIPADRLLVYDVADGWAPLCDFLEIDIPKAAFSVTNTAKDFNQRR